MGGGGCWRLWSGQLGRLLSLWFPLWLLRGCGRWEEAGAGHWGGGWGARVSVLSVSGRPDIYEEEAKERAPLWTEGIWIRFREFGFIPPLSIEHLNNSVKYKRR